MKAKTYISIILDRSGSMNSIAESAIFGYNEQVKACKEQAKDQEIKVNLISFNNDVYEHQWLTGSENLVESVYSDYCPSGGTALYDAIGYTIDKIEKTTDKDEDCAHLVIVITDGEENASTHYNAFELNKKISALRETNKWTFTFMGCDKDYLTGLAQRINVPSQNCAVMNTQSVDSANFAYAKSSECLRSYLSARSCTPEVTCSSNFYNADASFECADFSEGVLPFVTGSVTVNPPIIRAMSFLSANDTTPTTEDPNAPKVFRTYTKATW